MMSSLAPSGLTIGTSTQLRAAWRRKPASFRIGLVILLIHLTLAASGPYWAPYGFAQMGTGIPLSGMSWSHPFGVDLLGRDIFSRVIYGEHIVIILSLCGTFLGLCIGSALGLYSGYVGGLLDEIVQRMLEAIISIPFLILALITVTAAGPNVAGSPLLIVCVVGFVHAPRIARMARSAAIDIATREFVTTARLRGESAWSIVRREFLPNATSVLLMEFALRAGTAPILVGSLGFLGFGLRPPTPEWGVMISENRALFVVSPMTVFGPGLMLASLVVGLNLFTEGLSRIFGRTVNLAAK